MPNVTFVFPDGRRVTVEGRIGDSVMHTAVSNDVDGIIGECGGSMMCATCHCYVDEEWRERAGPRSDGEDELLESAASEVRPGSRLSCQIKLSPTFDGLVVCLPEAQQ